MSNITTFYITTIPAGIALIMLMRSSKKLNKLMIRENPRYSGHVNNSIDVFRILKTVNRSKTISKAEKMFLIKSLILIGVSWLTAIIWVVLFVLFSDFILD